MPAKLDMVRAGDVGYSGALRTIPGLDTYANPTLDSFPGQIFAKVATFSTGAGAPDSITDQGIFYFPYRARLLSVKVNGYQKSKTGTGIINLGTYTAGTLSASYFGAVSMTTSLTNGELTTMPLSNTVITAGTLMILGSDGGSTSEGKNGIHIVFVPEAG